MFEVIFLGGGCVVDVEGFLGDEGWDVFVAFVFALGLGRFLWGRWRRHCDGRVYVVCVFRNSSERSNIEVVRG